MIPILLHWCAATAGAQTGLTSTWRIETAGTPPWTVVLRADETDLTGAVSACPQMPVEIHAGRIEGNTFTFKCTSEDKDCTITFVGRIDGDEIAITREVHVWDGGHPVPPGASEGILTGAASSRFTAKRITGGADAELAEIADGVRGVELAAAVNLLPNNVKVEGRLFLPQNIDHARAVIVVLEWGISGTLYWESQVRRLSRTLTAGLLLARISRIVPGPVGGPRPPNPANNAALGLVAGCTQRAGVADCDWSSEVIANGETPIVLQRSHQSLRRAEL